VPRPRCAPAPVGSVPRGVEGPRQQRIRPVRRHEVGWRDDERDFAPKLWPDADVGPWQLGDAHRLARLEERGCCANADSRR